VSSPNDSLTGIWLAFALITFVFAWPELIDSVSFLGNSIKMREVNKAIDELKLLAEVNISTLLEVIQTQMRFGGVPEEKRLEMLSETTKVLENLGFGASEITKIQSRYHYWVESDYVRAILVSSNIQHPSIDTPRMHEWQTKRDRFVERADRLAPDDLRDIFKGFDAYNEKIQSAIEDYEYYRINKKHRDLEKWKHRNDWFAL
jgi:Txe/YoeB family toxin of Txe-Axe toxin-antitoxin module